MNDISSEYQLSVDDDLRVSDEALFIDGVGVIGQYHSYLDTLWEKSVPYFVRDVYYEELQKTLQKVELLTFKFNSLNSKILAYESCQLQCLHQVDQ